MSYRALQQQTLDATSQLSDAGLSASMSLSQWTSDIPHSGVSRDTWQRETIKNLQPQTTYVFRVHAVSPLTGLYDPVGMPQLRQDCCCTVGGGREAVGGNTLGDVAGPDLKLLAPINLRLTLTRLLPSRCRPHCGKHPCRQRRLLAVAARQAMYSRGAMCARDAGSLLSC